MTTNNTPAPTDGRSDDTLLHMALLSWKNGDTSMVTVKQLIRRRELESQLQLLGNLGYDRRLDDPILFCGGNEAYPREQRLQELQAELDKLTEGRGE
jgi:hypothetical protein